MTVRVIREQPLVDGRVAATPPPARRRPPPVRARPRPGPRRGAARGPAAARRSLRPPPPGCRCAHATWATSSRSRYSAPSRCGERSADGAAAAAVLAGEGDDGHQTARGGGLSRAGSELMPAGVPPAPAPPPPTGRTRPARRRSARSRMICSMPPRPSLTGTPTKRPLSAVLALEQHSAGQDRLAVAQDGVDHLGHRGGRRVEGAARLEQRHDLRATVAGARHERLDALRG